MLKVPKFPLNNIVSRCKDPDHQHANYPTPPPFGVSNYPWPNVVPRSLVDGATRDMGTNYLECFEPGGRPYEGDGNVRRLSLTGANLT